ncbi:hypothetical protein PSYPI_29119, partial [Pseudomonas syringae pv. pisi str. 1704B]
ILSVQVFFAALLFAAKRNSRNEKAPQRRRFRMLRI